MFLGLVNYFNRRIDQGEFIERFLEGEAFYNSNLKVTSDSSARICHYCLEESKPDHEKLEEISLTKPDYEKAEELYSSTKPIINFPKIQMSILEKIMGYKRI